MQALNFDETLDRILQKDTRYHRDGYLFIREALDYTQKMVTKTGTKGDPRHVTGQELLAGIRSYGLEQFGPMTMMVLGHWGIHRCEDFGEIVFNMVESSLLAKTKKDSREDFRGGYDFVEAFRQPFLPSRPLDSAEPQPAANSAQV